MDRHRLSITPCMILFALATIVLGGGRPGPTTDWKHNMIIGIRTCGNGKIYDITHKYTVNLPKFGSKNGMGKFIFQTKSIKNGSIVNEADIQLTTHSGTHVDAPSHFYESYFEEGFDVDSLDLYVLNGPALVVDVPRNSNITADVMKSLNISKEIHRVLFRTLNTDRKLMYKKEFDSSFVGFMADGAKWVVENTNIKLVGLDYLSISAYVDAAPTHLEFLKDRKITVVEGLKLDGIKAGVYNLHCLPLRLQGADGSPTRCILIDNFHH